MVKTILQICLLIMMLPLPSCKSIRTKSGTRAFEQKVGWFASDRDRIYLAYKDPTANTGQVVTPGPEFPLNDQDGAKAIGVQYAFSYSYDNPPKFADEQVPGISSPLSVQVIYCENERLHDYSAETSRSLEQEFKVPFEQLPDMRGKESQYGYPSHHLMVCDSTPCLPFNERIRLADFPLLEAQACQAIGSADSMAQSTADFARRARAYADDHLKPQVSDWIGVGMSSLCCASFVAGPALNAMMKTGEKLVSMSVGTSHLNRAAASLGLSLVNSSYQLQSFGIAVGNVLQNIKLFGKGADQWISGYIAPYTAIDGLLSKRLRSAFVVVLKRITTKLITNNALLLGSQFLNFMLIQAESDKIYDQLDLTQMERQEIEDIVDQLGQLQNETDENYVRQELQNLLARLDVLATREDQEILLASAESAQFKDILTQASSFVTDPDFLLDFALQGAALILPGAACVETVSDSLKIYRKYRQSGNLQNFVMAAEMTRKETEDFLVARQFKFAELKNRLQVDPDDRDSFVQYQNLLIPQFVYAFNKLEHESTFDNGINPFNPHAAREELKESMSEIANSAPEVIISLNTAILLEAVKNLSETDDVMKFVQAGMKAGSLK